MIKILKYIEFMRFAIAAIVWWLICVILMSLICVCGKIIEEERLTIREKPREQTIKD